VDDGGTQAPLFGLLRATIRSAIGGGRTTYKTLKRQTGVTRADIMWFARGTQSFRLSMADRLAAYCGLELGPRRKKG
jgi:hypothetical protein